MTASIEKLIQEQKEKQRLENELAIAQEVQAQLFPRQVSELESLEVHGFCRPARTVSGDYYDFLTASSHKLILAVGDISGKGISAALVDGDHPLGRSRLQRGESAPDAGTGGRGRGRRRGPSHGNLARRAWRFLPEPCSACSIISSTKALRRRSTPRSSSESTTAARTT